MKKFAPLIFVLLLAACKADKLDPCEGVPRLSADFKIQEVVGDSLIETDKVLMFGYVTFSMPNVALRSYKWTIGEDPREFTDRNVTLRFPREAIGKIDVQLIVSTSSPNSCFPDDPLVDTVVKSFEVIDWKDAPMIGKYEGAFGSTPNMKDTVELRFISMEENIKYEPYGGFELININKGCNLNPDTPGLWQGGRGVYATSFEARSSYFYGCNGVDAWLMLQGEDTLKVDFSTGNLDNEDRSQDSFLGIRIPQ